MNGPPKAVGIPEFWPTAYNVNPAGFDAIYALGPLFDKLRSQTVNGKLAATLGRLMSVAYKSLGALTTLALNGFDADAMKIARATFEYEVIGAYLIKHPDLVDDYFEFVRVSMQQDYDWLQQHAPDALSELHEETHRKIVAEVGKIDAKFRTKSGGLRKSWKDIQIAEMANDTGREHVYRSVYRWGSGLVHGDVTMFASAEGGGAEIEPSTNWTHSALMTGHNAVICLMEAFNEHGKLGLDVDLIAAVEALKKAWEPTEFNEQVTLRSTGTTPAREAQ